jgi:hypothetical protein
MTTTTDLAVVADRLSRAADLIEKLTQSAGGPRGRWYADREYVWLGDDRVDAENEWDADYLATFDPRAVAALVPVLRMTAALLPGHGEHGALHTFAARVLREEETGG